MQSICKAFQQEYVDESSGVIKGDTQCSHALAIQFDLLNPGIYL